MLKFFQHHYRFPESRDEIPTEIVMYVARQINVPPQAIESYSWGGTRMREHRVEIRDRMGFEVTTLAHQKELRTWLQREILPQEHRLGHLESIIYQHLRQRHLEPPSRKQVMRLLKSAISRHENHFFNKTHASLSPDQKANLQRLIYPESHEEEDGESVPSYLLHHLKVGAGAPTVKNIKRVANRLKVLQAMELPTSLFEDISWGFLQQYKQQVAVEAISQLQRRDKNERQRVKLYTMLAVFCWVRQREITDYLVNLFIRTLANIHLGLGHMKSENMGRKTLSDVYPQNNCGLIFELVVKPLLSLRSSIT